MYGTGIGTGVGGVGLLAGGIATGSGVLVAVAACALSAMCVTLVRNARRLRADQRP